MTDVTINKVIISKERIFEVIRRPLITEKSTLVSQYNQTAFEVSMDSNKAEIKVAIEFLFKVEIESVNIINQKGKTKIFKGKKGTRKSYKKAIVRIKEGQSIDLSSGV